MKKILLIGQEQIMRLSMPQDLDCFQFEKHIFPFNENDIWCQIHNQENWKNFDLIHSFLGFPYTKLPWLTTSDVCLPSLLLSSYEEQIQIIKLFQYLVCQDNCKKVILWSEWVGNFYRYLHQDFAHADVIFNKLKILFPSVPIYRRNSKKFVSYDGYLHIIFIGRNFFRKGGIVALRLAQKASLINFPLKVHIVSKLEHSPIFIDHPNIHKYDNDLKLLHLDNVIFHGELQNSEIFRLLNFCHFQVLATLQDSFAYSILEGFSTATPIITNPIGAIPEFVHHGQNGYLLQLSANSGNWVGVENRKRDLDLYWQNLDETFSDLAEQILTLLINFWNSSSRSAEYEKLSSGALNQVLEHHNSEKHAQQLNAIYDECLSDIPKTSKTKKQSSYLRTSLNLSGNFYFKSTMTRKVSVIIPTYNSAKFIAKAIDSVINQTYTNLEIIIIDDGSTDNTRQVLWPFLNHIKYYYQNNQGVSVARNRGIQESSGELLAFLDADDFFILPSKIEEQVSFFIRDDELDIVQSGWCLVNQQGNPLFNKELKPWQESEPLDLKNWLLWGHVLPSAIMIRKKSLEKVGGFNPEFSHSEDMDIILRLASLGCKSKWLKKNTVAYRQHSYNASWNLAKKAADYNKVLDNFFSQPDLPEEIRQLEDRCRYYHLVWVSLCFYETKDFSSMIQLLKESLKYRQHISATEIISDWIENFKSCSENKIGHIFNINHLLSLPEWQEFMRSLCFDNSFENFFKRNRNENVMNFQITANKEVDSLVELDYPKKINILEARKGHYGFHRSGIHYALEGLMPLHSEQGIFLDASLERKFAWHIAWTKVEDLKPYQKPWIGFIYVAPELPQCFDSDGHQSAKSIFKSQLWKESIKSCLGIFCLSNYHKQWLQLQLDVPVVSLILPTETPELKFSMDKFYDNPNKKLVQVGWWLRKLHSIYYLPKINRLEKAILTIDVNYIKKVWYAEKQAFNLKPYYNTVRTIPRLNDFEYDDLLSKNIVYVEMYNSCSNNILSECIVRNTPILINPLPAVIEYLGEHYPFYFESRSQAVKKAEDFDLIEKTYRYLQNHPFKEKMTKEYFLRSFATSEIYQNLPCI